MRGYVRLWRIPVVTPQRTGVGTLETIEQVLQLNRPGLPLWRPKALRLRGEVQLKLGRSELAEMDFREAIELVAKMSAKTWELPATTSLARLLRDIGRRGASDVDRGLQLVY
jgi:hypothetical protein